MEHFKQRAVIKFCANSELKPTETWNFFSEHTSGKTCSRMIISGVGDPVIPATELSTVKSQL